MGTLYGINLVVGGVLVLVTLFFGGDADVDADIDADFDVDADLDVDVDADIDGDVDIKPDIDAGLWLPIFSARFWIFGSAFFGLTGVLLSSLASVTGLSNSWVIAILSGVIGCSTGTASAYAFKWLKKSEANSMITTRQYIGRTAHVTLPFDAQSRGKITLEIGSSQIDFIAETDHIEGFQKNDFVNIIAMSDGVAKVVNKF